MPNPGQLDIYTASPSKDYRKRPAPLTYVVLSVYTHIHIGCGAGDICWQLSVWQWDVCADAGLCDGVLVPGDHTCPLSGTRRLFWCTGKHALQIGPWRSVVVWKLEQSQASMCVCPLPNSDSVRIIIAHRICEFNCSSVYRAIDAALWLDYFADSYSSAVIFFSVPAYICFDKQFYILTHHQTSLVPRPSHPSLQY